MALRGQSSRTGVCRLLGEQPTKVGAGAERLGSDDAVDSDIGRMLYARQ